jgi:hypothetical protein
MKIRAIALLPKILPPRRALFCRSQLKRKALPKEKPRHAGALSNAVSRFFL